MREQEYQDLLEKYKAKIREEFGPKAAQVPAKVTTREYLQFRRELYPAHYSWYERAANFAEGILRLNLAGEKADVLQRKLDLCHLQVTPAGVTSLAILSALLVAVIGTPLGFLLSLILAGGQSPNPFFPILFLIAAALTWPAVQKIPDFMANTWRMKASNQMVQAIFYLVTYMRHTSNLERAIEFAADHLEQPLSLDFRKILWDVETQKYSTIKESAAAYLRLWEKDDKDFVEAFHLVEASLFEGSEERRLSLLDKSLDVILNGTYENMLHYAHDLQSPMTMLHMLGIILPILGLVILPLVVSFMGSDANPLATSLVIAALYNLALPAGVFYLGKSILTQRPAGYGAVDVSEQDAFRDLRYVQIPLGKKLIVKINPLYLSIILLAVTIIIGISPLLLHAGGAADFAFDAAGNLKMLDYLCPPSKPTCAESDKIGPYGMGAAILSILLIAGIGTSLGLYYSLRSKNVLQIREKTKLLEEEFSSALFQLGNRLGDGLPAEIALAKVAESMKGTTSGEFFNIAEKNITRLGMGLEQALLDPKVGALVSFPSKVIESSMKVLVESLHKGPRIAAQAILSMSRYIKEIHRVEERLRDLMAEVISSMKSQIKFLTPAIAGIVIGITSMISTILTKLNAQLKCFSQGSDVSSMGNILEIFGLGVPTYQFQIIVGFYIIQIIYILTVLSSGIENGADPLGERFSLGQNLLKSTWLYCFIAAVVMLAFNFFAATIMQASLQACG